MMRGRADSTKARLPLRWPMREIGKTALFLMLSRPIDTRRPCLESTLSSGRSFPPFQPEKRARAGPFRIRVKDASVVHVLVAGSAATVRVALLLLTRIAATALLILAILILTVLILAMGLVALLLLAALIWVAAVLLPGFVLVLISHWSLLASASLLTSLNARVNSFVPPAARPGSETACYVRFRTSVSAWSRLLA